MFQRGARSLPHSVHFREDPQGSWFRLWWLAHRRHPRSPTVGSRLGPCYKTGGMGMWQPAKVLSQFPPSSNSLVTCLMGHCILTFSVEPEISLWPLPVSFFLWSDWRHQEIICFCLYKFGSLIALWRSHTTQREQLEILIIIIIINLLKFKPNA